MAKMKCPDCGREMSSQTAFSRCPSCGCPVTRIRKSHKRQLYFAYAFLGLFIIGGLFGGGKKEKESGTTQDATEEIQAVKSTEQSFKQKSVKQNNETIDSDVESVKGETTIEMNPIVIPENVDDNSSEDLKSEVLDTPESSKETSSEADNL